MLVIWLETAHFSNLPYEGGEQTNFDNGCFYWKTRALGLGSCSKGDLERVPGYINTFFLCKSGIHPLLTAGNIEGYSRKSRGSEIYPIS